MQVLVLPGTFGVVVVVVVAAAAADCVGFVARLGLQSVQPSCFGDQSPVPFVKPSWRAGRRSPGWPIGHEEQLGTWRRLDAAETGKLVERPLRLGKKQKGYTIKIKSKISRLFFSSKTTPRGSKWGSGWRGSRGGCIGSWSCCCCRSRDQSFVTFPVGSPACVRARRPCHAFVSRRGRWA